MKNNLEVYMSSNSYSFKKGLIKGIVSVVVFSIPVLINEFPQWANLSLGGVLVIAVNFLKTKYL